jgi:MFS family permease
VPVPTYREVFAVPEFRPLFTAICVRTAAGTLEGLALATLVYSATRSPLLSALAMFGSSFAQVIGAATLLSAADRVPPRQAMVAIGLIFTAGTLLMAVPGLPVSGLLLVTLAMGLASSAGGGIQWGLVTEIVPADLYILGRSVFNMSVGVMQIAGFAVGGALVSLASPRGALLVAAALYLASTIAVRVALAPRPARAAGRISVSETLRVNARLWAVPARRYVYLALWVPNGLIVGCEALYIPYAPGWASALFIGAALGMLAGDTVMGRFVPRHWRHRLATPLRLLLAVPYLVFVLRPPAAVAVAAVCLASVGYSASLLLQDQLVAVTPESMRGQALGLQSSGMLTMQAVGAAVAGALAQWLPTATTMTVTAAASIAVTLALTPGLRRPAGLPGPADMREPADLQEPAAAVLTPVPGQRHADVTGPA